MVPLVIRSEDLQTGAVAKSAFIKSPVRIGRSELNDLPLVQGFVSQWHAIVQFDDSGVRYVDLGSTNGSVVDGVRVDSNVPVAIVDETEIRIGALKLTFSRRATGEHRAPPRTIFAMRAATAFHPGTPAAGAPQVSGAPAGTGAPAPAEKDGHDTESAPTTGTHGVAVAPGGALPAPPHATPSAVTPGSAEAAAPASAEGAASPSAEAAPLSAAPPAAAAPMLDLPTGFRPAAAPPAAAPSPPAAPMLDLPTGFRPAAGVPEPAAPASGASPASRGAPVLDLPTEFRPAVAAPVRSASAAPPGHDLPLAASHRRPLKDSAGLAPPPGAGAPSPATFSPPAQVAAAPRPATAPRAAAVRPSDLERLVTTFAESYLPANEQIRGFEDAQIFLGKLAEALEAFARSFVEMRKGYEEFGKQMGIRTVHGDGPVQRARDPRQLIAALLAPGQQGRASELQGSFADFMVHQVALLNGVVEGAKAILTRVSPEEIEAAAPQSLWPMKAQTLWKAFEERFHELFDEDSAISDALFGREFGKAYTTIVGQRGADEDDEEEEEEEEEPKRPAKKGPRRR